MDITTFFRTAKYITPEITPSGKVKRAPAILISGPHGRGKSSIVKLFAKKVLNIPLIDRRLGQMTEGDMIGLPKVDGDITRFLPVDFIKRACNEPICLFFDEANRATREVLQVLFQVALDHELNGQVLHPGTRIIIAMNEGSAYQVTKMDPALKDRFWKIFLAPTQEEWFTWAEDTTEDGGSIDSIILNFLKGSPEWLDYDKVEDSKEKYQSRRAWEMVNRPWKLMQEEPDFDPFDPSKPWKSLVSALFAGFVGDIATSAFVSFLEAYCTSVSAEDLLKDFKKAWAGLKLLKGDKWNICSQKLTDYTGQNLLTDAQVSELGKFMKIMPSELRMNMWTILSSQNGHVNARTEGNIKKIHYEIKDFLLSSISGKEKDKKKNIAGSMP